MDTVNVCICVVSCKEKKIAIKVRKSDAEVLSIICGKGAQYHGLVHILYCSLFIFIYLFYLNHTHNGIQ